MVIPILEDPLLLAFSKVCLYDTVYLQLIAFVKKIYQYKSPTRNTRNWLIVCTLILSSYTLLSRNKILHIRQLRLIQRRSYDQPAHNVTVSGIARKQLVILGF
uniref:Uncharacterized protein n=1 Tax=Spironucleus salmonicida TaxID=348837 RepID=V6LTS8_9EUKA|eukprot:EST43780.1 Hypothetical protein SS50377_16521 [Spironucleus salmonicida]